MRFHVLFGDGGIHALANSLGMKPANRLTDADIVFFPGGPDVNPTLYGEKPHHTTFFDVEKNEMEEKVFDILRDKVYKVGICGGGQALNVLNGGKMFQHSDHPRFHDLFYLSEGGVEKHQVNSTHHQIMRVGIGADVWGYCTASTFREQGPGAEPPKEFEYDNEIVFYPDTRSLCFQPHPEYDHAETTKLFQKCLTRMFNYYGDY